MKIANNLVGLVLKALLGKEGRIFTPKFEASIKSVEGLVVDIKATDVEIRLSNQRGDVSIVHQPQTGSLVSGPIFE